MKKMLMALLLCAALLPLWAGACAAENTPVYIAPAEGEIRHPCKPGGPSRLA